MPLAVDIGHNLGGLRGECERLRKHKAEIMVGGRDQQLVEAKRLATQAASAVANVKATWDSKLYAEKRAFEDARREDAERMERYEKKCAENAARIASLEREIAALKGVSAAAAAPALNGAPPARPAPAASCVPAVKTTGEETLPAFMARLRLLPHVGTLEAEELDVPLLRSMGPDVLATNMAELGLTPEEVQRMSHALFPADLS